jgi:hypothetical protein
METDDHLPDYAAFDDAELIFYCAYADGAYSEGAYPVLFERLAERPEGTLKAIAGCEGLRYDQKVRVANSLTYEIPKERRAEFSALFTDWIAAEQGFSQTEIALAAVMVFAIGEMS